MADTDSSSDSETIVASSAASRSSNAGGSATPRQTGVTKLNLRVDMTVAELVAWLEQSGIPSKFLHVFEDNYIDGEEFNNLTETEVKEIIPAMGIAKKVCRLLPKNAAVSLPATQRQEKSPLSPHLPLSPGCSIISSHKSPPPSSTCGSMSSSKNVDIPHLWQWREDVQIALGEEGGALTPPVRDHIVRTLVTLLQSKVGPKPSRSQCEDVARRLILKYKCMRDDLGTGYASWVDKMITRIHNVNKSCRKKIQNSAPTPTKRPKLSTEKEKLQSRYPVRCLEDEGTEDGETVQKHMSAIAAEMKRSNPRDHVLTPLMKDTYRCRRMFIRGEAMSAMHIVKKYPPLARPAIVAQEMDLILQRKDVKGSFLSEWTSKYVPGILSYGESCTKKGVLKILEGYTDSDDMERQMVALEILCQLLCPRPKTAKKEEPDHLVYLLKEYPLTSTPQDAAKDTPVRNSPWIAVFRGEERAQFFVMVEQRVLCEVPSLQVAVFVCFAAYYIFDLVYPRQVNNLLLFFQDYILSFPDSTKRPGNYLAMGADIRKHVCGN